MRSIWAVSLIIAAAVCGWLFASYRQPPAVELKDASLIFIGTSMTKWGVPVKSPPDGLLGDGERHARLTAPAARERRCTQMLRAVLDIRSVRSVYVEIYPYITSIGRARSQRSIDVPWMNGSALFGDAWAAFGEAIRYSFAAIVGLRGDDFDFWFKTSIEPANLDRSFDGNVGRDFRPPRVRAPDSPAALLAALATARARGVKVVFIALPRSAAATAFSGPEFEVSLVAALSEFERRFGVEVWTPALSWPDDDFVDRVHLNARGRVRFLEAFRARFGSQNERD